MSTFNDFMEVGALTMFDQLADDRAYWPKGDSGSATTIPVIFHETETVDEPTERGAMEVARGEAQVQVSDVAAPVIKSDVIVIGSDNWRVMEVLETVGGIHRLQVEKQKRSVRGGSAVRRG